MQFRKSSCDEGLKSYGLFVPKCSQKHDMAKDRKLKDFHFSSVCEESESPCTLR